MVGPVTTPTWCALASELGFRCTLEQGHPGAHTATIPGGRIVDTWCDPLEPVDAMDELLTHQAALLTDEQIATYLSVLQGRCDLEIRPLVLEAARRLRAHSRKP